MAQLDDALNSILGNQQAMAQIMALANSLSGELSPDAPDGPEGEEACTPPPEPVSEPPDFTSPPPIEEDRDLALLGAVKPFLRPERQEKLDQALDLVRMLRMFRMAFPGKEDPE